jgi:tRNA threonylcarbamoyladenosine biosynthesis protein TsaE
VHVVPPRAARGRIALTLPELVAWGERFGRALTPPNLVALSGDLGAGKTTLIQSICLGYGVTDPVTSPTFALVHEYHAPRSPVYHIDLYRLERPADLTNIGWDDIMQREALILVEWPERAGDRLPAAHVPIDLEHLPDEPDKRVLLAG